MTIETPFPQISRVSFHERLRVARCRLFASPDRLLDASDFEVEFPSDSPAIILGLNGSGKSLCTAALQLAMGAAADDDMLRADLLSIGIDHIEVDFVANGSSGRLRMSLQTGERSLRWNESADRHNGNQAIHEGIQRLLADRWTGGLLPRETSLLYQAHFVRNCDMSLPLTSELLSVLRALALKPIDREFGDWTVRLHSLAGEHDDAGRLAEERRQLHAALERVRYVEELQAKLEQAQQFSAELQVRMVQLMSQLTIVNAEYEESAKLSAVAERARRVAAWLDEIHREHDDVAKLRERHAFGQERLDVLEQTFRGAPENLESLLHDYQEAADLATTLERKLAAAEGEIRRMDEAILSARHELEECVLPSPDRTQSEQRAWQQQIDAAESQLTVLLRERITLVRQREGLQSRLRQDFPLFCDLDEAARKLVISYADWAADAGTRAAQCAHAEERAETQRKAERERIEHEIQSSYTEFDQLSGNAIDLLRELFDRRRLLLTLKADREETARRREILEARGNGRRRGLWIASAAVVGAIVGAVTGGWDVALFAAVVASGLAYLSLKMIHGSADRELEAALQAGEMVAARTAEINEAIAKLESVLSPLAGYAVFDEAANELHHYEELTQRLEQLNTSANQPASYVDPEQEALENFRLHLPARLLELPPAVLKSQYEEFVEVDRELAAADSAWQEFETGGRKTAEVHALETQAAERREQLREAVENAERRVRENENRRREISERLTVLESVRAVERPADIREAELADVQARLAQIIEEAAGFIGAGAVEPEIMAEQLRARDELRGEIRRIRDALSAYQSLDELHARESLLADELDSVKQKLTEMDPLYLLDGTVVDYAAKYARQLAAAGDAMTMTEGAIDALRRDLETVEIDRWRDHLSQCEPIAELREVVQQREQQVERTEYEAQIAKEALAHLRTERDVVEQTHDQQLFDAIGERLHMLTDGRCRGVRNAAERVNIDFADGTTRPISALSGGLSDVAWIAVRLAVADAVQDPLIMPVFWDEPFTRLDDHHLARVREALREMAAARQVVLLTRDSRLAAWGTMVHLGAGEITDAEAVRA